MVRKKFDGEHVTDQLRMLTSACQPGAALLGVRGAIGGHTFPTNLWEMVDVLKTKQDPATGSWGEETQPVDDEDVWGVG